MIKRGSMFLLLITSQMWAANASFSNYSEGAVVRFEVDIKEEQALQKEVEDGHQPWRLEPTDVAYVAAVSIDKTVQYESCQITYEKANESRVRCEGSKPYIIRLRRLIKSDGIWTAVEMEPVRQGP
jgi:hypothetical protein